MFLESLRLDGLLSFAPGSQEVPLRNLNVLIGPNGSGKSNLIEAVELLRATPTAFAQAIRDGGGAREWLWKGDGGGRGSATIEARLHWPQWTPLRYRLSFVANGTRTEVVDEALEEAEKHETDAKDVYFYYRFQNGRPALNVREKKDGQPMRRSLKREKLAPDESVLSQVRDPDRYPELAWCADGFASILTFREWTFGRYAGLREPQKTDLPDSVLLPDARNLALVLNQIEHSGAGTRLEELMRRFLPRFRRLSTLVQGGTIQFFLHEDGCKEPIPATRLSDGTMRFLAMCAALLSPTPPSLLCIEEPELGLHPDALAVFAELLVEASDRMQIIVTTHADSLVSALTEHLESVLVCEHRGGTKLTRLESAPLRHWLEEYRLGDLWRMGELGGNP